MRFGAQFCFTLDELWCRRAKKEGVGIWSYFYLKKWFPRNQNLFSCSNSDKRKNNPPLLLAVSMIMDIFTHITNAAVTGSVLLWAQYGLVGVCVLLERYKTYPAPWFWQLVLTFAMCSELFWMNSKYIVLTRYITTLSCWGPVKEVRTERDTYTGQSLYSFYHELVSTFSDLSCRADEDIAIDGFLAIFKVTSLLITFSFLPCRFY